MLTFKNIRLFYMLFLTAALLGYVFITDGFIIVASLLTVAYVGLIVYGVFNVSAGFFLKLYNAVDTQEKKIALTFDDGPTEQTTMVLDILKQYNVKATFFLIGKRVEQHPEVVHRLLQEGHEIANHTYNHSNATGFYSIKRLESEITRTTDLVKQLTGLKMNLYRPPFGVTTPRLAKVVSQLQLKVIGWSVRSFDTTNQSVEAIIHRILGNVKPGAVVLMHDDRVKCAAVLETIIPQLIKREFTFSTVGELFNLEVYEKD